MNEKQFQQAANISAGLAARWFQPVSAALEEFCISKPADIAMWIAQVGHESGGFARLSESLNYTPTALVATFGKHRITQYQAEMLGRTSAHPANQQAIANLVYGGEWGKANLGNQVAGDGWRYRGRGLIQTTGLANYRRTGDTLKLDLVAEPDLLQTDEPAARSAAWFYVSRGCLNHTNNISMVTKLINGGQTGIDDRLKRYKLARAVLA